MKLIPLSQGQSAIVDDDDFDKFGNVKWYACWDPKTKSFRARRSVPFAPYRQRTVLLHRLISGEPIGMLVDHRNHDTLDCRKENLRICDGFQNGRNRDGASRRSKSGVRGVVFHKATNKWLAQIGVNWKMIYLGIFENKIDAIAARSAASLKYHGEFAGRI